VITTEMLKIQFYDSYNMLYEFVKVCPDELWSSENHGLPTVKILPLRLIPTLFGQVSDWGLFRRRKLNAGKLFLMVQELLPLIFTLLCGCGAGGNLWLRFNQIL